MEISTEIKKHVRLHNVKGLVDIGELTEYLKNIYNSPDIDLEINVFWNLQEADLSSVSAEEVRSFAEFVGRHRGKGGRGKTALVVSRDLEYGMSRMYQVLMKIQASADITIFQDINEAKEWMEIE